MLVNQVVLNPFHDSRVGSPLCVSTPNLLELFYLVLLPGNLEILVHGFPGTIECTDNPPK